MAPAIMADNLGKRYSLPDSDRAWTFQEAVVALFRRGRRRNYLWALRGASFSIPRGRMVGIIGPNGAGKSTLLRLIGGLSEPDEGTLTTNGHVSGLLELGAGFHPDLTGRENVFITGVVGGLTRAEVAERFQRIVDFAELSRFIDSPLRTYSSGMYMRLAFSVAIHAEPDILLIDEVLAVGDQEFQSKCNQRIAEFRAGGATIVLVSHDARVVRELCDDALWIEDGAIVELGKAADVASRYMVHGETRRRTPRDFPAARTPGGVELRIDENRLGSQEVSISGCRLRDEQGRSVADVARGGSFVIEIAYAAARPIEDPIFNVCVSDASGRICFETTAESRDIRIGPVHGPGSVIVGFAGVDLAPGAYFIDIGIYEKDWKYGYDYHWRAYSLTVHEAEGDQLYLSKNPMQASWSGDRGVLIT